MCESQEQLLIVLFYGIIVVYIQFSRLFLLKLLKFILPLPLRLQKELRPY